MSSLFEKLISTTIQQFILQHEHDDVNLLLLKYDSFDGVPMTLITDQINGRRKAKEKMPLYYRTTGIVYPPGVNVEQCSSDTTARFKASTIHALIGDTESCADLTGGFGIDAIFMSNEFRQMKMVEPDSSLLKISEHNHSLLDVRNISYENMTAEDFLRREIGKYSLFYMDPSRRPTLNRKVFSLQDCVPDVTALQAKIFDHTDYLLLKSSPLLDIKHALTEMLFVSNVYVVSVNNECKELLFFSQKGFSQNVSITATNISRITSSHSFDPGDEQDALVSFSDPLKYLYEPNAALLKAGAFKLVAKWFNLHKLAPNTHLYTSNEMVPDFPGRTFEVRALVKPRAKSLKQYFPDGKANITLRNYPMTVRAMKKATGLQDGGDKFLLGFSGRDRKFLAAADKIARDM